MKYEWDISTGRMLYVQCKIHDITGDLKDTSSVALADTSVESVRKIIVFS